MTQEGIAEALEELKEVYGEVAVAAPAPGQTLIRIKEVSLPTGCAPTSTPVLLVIQEGQRPQLYVKGGIKLPNAGTPRNYSAAQVAGEEWWTFSYSFSWTVIRTRWCSSSKPASDVSPRPNEATSRGGDSRAGPLGGAAPCGGRISTRA